MRMIAAVSPISGGELRILGRDPATEGPAIRGRLGVCPQDDTLDTELTVFDNLFIYGRYFGTSRGRGARAGPGAARVRPAHRQGEGQGRGALRRHEAAADDRALADQPARPAAARRADDRARPAGPPPVVGQAVPAQADRGHARDHHPLHGRGRAALRPAGGDGQGRDRRRGLARGADRRALHARGRRAALRAGRRRRCRPGPRRPGREGRRPGRAGRGAARPAAGLQPRRRRGGAKVHERGLRPVAVLVRRSTLEDVFLRLTGRTLVD